MNQKSNLHYIRVITPKRETSGEPHLCGLAPEQHPLKNVAAVANRWRHCVHLIGPGTDPQTWATKSGGREDFLEWLKEAF